MHRMRRTKQAFPRATVETHTGPPSGIRRRRPICDRSEMTGAIFTKFGLAPRT
jgi:hypothetical protein